MVPPDQKDDPDAPPPSEDPGRPLTIDDVPRLGSGTGIAIGCVSVVAAAILVFWLIRGWLMPG
jgi:hypothetical protein